MKMSTSRTHARVCWPLCLAFLALMPTSAGAQARNNDKLIYAAGEHTDAVLADCGFTPDEVAKLREAGAVR